MGYNIDLWVKNKRAGSQSAQVTVDLIASNTGQIRDEFTQVVNLQPDEIRQLTFTLDGEQGIQYQYKYNIKNI